MRDFRIPWRSRARIRADLDAELEFHFQMRAEELMTQGLNADDARREAEREFGDQAYTRAYCERLDRAGERDARWREWLAQLRQDLRLTARGIRLRPAYSAVVILTLALGVGANAAAFSVLDSVLLARLPFPRADRLLSVDELNLQTGAVHSDIAAAEYLDWACHTTRLTGIAMHGAQSLTYTGGTAPELLSGRRVSANFFDVLGVRAALGRTFAVGEDRGVNRSLVISDGAWKRLFGADPSIVGRAIPLGGDSYTIVGVLPESFVFPGNAPREIYTTIDFTRAMSDVNRARKFHFMHGIARLADGATLADARADLTAIARRAAHDNPATSTGHLVTVEPLGDALVRGVRPTILALMGAALFVLLIAAANLANLALSRSLLRRQEFAVRAALGASRARLVRLALVESVTLSLVGGAIGLAGAWWGTPIILHLYPHAVPSTFAVHVGALTFVVAFAAAAITGVAFGLIPALASWRSPLVRALRDGGRGASSGRVSMRARNALVVSQVAVTMVLVIGAGLLIQTLMSLQSVPLGFEAERTSMTWLTLAGPRYRDARSIVAFWDAVEARLRQERSIESVGLGGSVPLAGGSGASLAIEGRQNAEPLPPIRYTVFSDGMRRTLGIQLVAGRDFTHDDGPDVTPVVLINEAAAKKFFPDANPVGAHVRLGPDPSQPWAEIVGVVRDFRAEQLDADPAPMAISAARQDVWPAMFVTVRSARPTAEVSRIVAGAIHELDPSLAVGELVSLRTLVDGELGPRRFAMSILTAFGALALVLAIVGVYGVISYGVAARRQELGVRVALGALPSQLMSSVLRHGALLAAIGLAIGCGGAFAMTRFLANLLFGVRPLDAGTFAAAGAVLAAATLVACWLPARRAARADPMAVLRQE
jgi:predicted permease